MATDVPRGYAVPYGTAVLNENLRGSKLHTALKGKVKVHLEGGLGCVDVLPSPSTACIYITGEEVAANVSPATRTRLTALAKSTVRGIVMVECSGVEAECFLALQAAGLELSLQTIPVSSPDHAAKYIVQMVARVCDSGAVLPAPLPPVDQALFHTVQCLPRTGPVKAKQLLQHFHSSKGISAASVEELQEVVGMASARAIHGFLHQKLLLDPGP